MGLLMMKRYIFHDVPCIQGWGSWVVPTRRPCLHPSPQASWHQDQECSRVYPSPETHNTVQARLGFKYFLHYIPYSKLMKRTFTNISMFLFVCFCLPIS